MRTRASSKLVRRAVEARGGSINASTATRSLARTGAMPTTAVEGSPWGRARRAAEMSTATAVLWRTSTRSRSRLGRRVARGVLCEAQQWLPAVHWELTTLVTKVVTTEVVVTTFKGL